jgi:hypothetical protein
MATFKTKSEMLEAGFVPVKNFAHSYRGIRLYVRDTSGSNSYGYASTIFAAMPHRIDERATQLFDIEFGEATTVWLTDELNKIKQPGCFILAFSPQTIEATIARANREIDAYRKTITDEMVAAADEEDRLAAEALAQADRAARAKINAAIIATIPTKIQTLPTMDRPMRGNQYIPMPEYGRLCAQSGKTAALENHRRNPEFISAWVSANTDRS